MELNELKMIQAAEAAIGETSIPRDIALECMQGRYMAPVTDGMVLKHFAGELPLQDHSHAIGPFTLVPISELVYHQYGE